MNNPPKNLPENILENLSCQVLFDTVADAMLLVDVGGRVVQANQAAQQLLEYSQETVSYTHLKVNPTYEVSLAFAEAVNLTSSWQKPAKIIDKHPTHLYYGASLTAQVVHSEIVGIGEMCIRDSIIR